MKEHPILFNGEMVRAYQDGRKSQTRRIVTARNSLVDGHVPSGAEWAALDFASAWVDPGPSPAGNPGPYLKVSSRNGNWVRRVYPRVQPGDRLWIRETWGYFGSTLCGKHYYNHVLYHADGARRDIPAATLEEMHARCPVQNLSDATPTSLGDWWKRQRKKPSIFVPRWACRYAPEVTAVRVERVQDISEMDMVAEGDPAPLPNGEDSYQWFRPLWDSIYAARGHGWAVNDLVWVYEFPAKGGDA